MTNSSRPANKMTEQKPWVEWPTLGLIVGHWLAFIFFALQYTSHSAFSLIGLALVLAFHSSLVHEIIHDHPFRSVRLNHLVAIIPLDLWLPYRLYRESHLKHHVSRNLTDPDLDPESNYISQEAYDQLSPLGRLWGEWQRPLLGRITIGAATRILRYQWRILSALIRCDAKIWRIYTEHVLWAIPVIYFITQVAHIPLVVYLTGAILPGFGLILVRSFAEHKALPECEERTAIVEHASFFGPLFLYNNLHALHHAEPMLPWYHYRARFSERRAELLNANGVLWYRDYWQLFKRYSLRPQDVWIDPISTKRTKSENQFS